jgi:phage host-nuclease inhibitor protein Gam
MTKTARKPKAKAPSPAIGINSVAELDAALAELGRIAGLEQQLQAECNAELQRVTSNYQAKMVVFVDDEAVAFTDRAAALMAQCEAYCVDHRDELLASGGKTRELTHGKIAWHAQKDALELIDTRDKEGWLSKVLGAVVETVTSLLNRTKAVAGISLGQVVKVKYSFDKAEIRKAAGTLNKRQLASLGFKLVERPEKLTIEPTTALVEQHSSAAA